MFVMKIKDIYESATTAGAIAVGAPAKIGKTQKRAGSLFKGKVTKKPFYEAEVNEEEIVEQDLILVPGQIRGKDKSFIPHEKDRRDHEVEMARSELFAAAKDAQRIYAMLKNRTEDEGLMGWQQSYITLAADYLNSVADSLEHQAHTNEMTGGVLAGGMSNESQNESPPEKDSLEYKALKRMKGPTEQDAIEALVVEIGIDRFKRDRQYYSELIPFLVRHYGQQNKVNELKSSTINDYISKSSAAVRGGRKEPPKFNPLTKKTAAPSWKVAAGKVNPDSVMGKYAKVKAGDLQGVAEGSEILKVGTAVRVPHKGKMVPGKIIRYDSGKGGESPAYVVDIGEYESKIVPVHNMKQGMPEATKKPNATTRHLRQYPVSDKDVAQPVKKPEKKKPEQGVAEEQAPMFTPEEEQLDEKKDACYSKVKSRYKVWPSAYASGALVKCRKVGASNWGNSSKK